MIYLDTSIALAHLLGEGRRPPDDLWAETLVSSRLIEYEAWNRIHSRGLAASHGEALRQILGRVSMLELSPVVLARAVEPFPAPVGTLDAIHLASADFLRRAGQDVRLASYDAHLVDAARKMGLGIDER